MERRAVSRSRLGVGRIVGSRTALAVLLTIGVASLAGCSKTAPSGKTAAESKGGSGSEPSTKVPASNNTGPSGKKETSPSATRGPATERAAGKNVVQLTDRTCVYFEPRWASIRVGESVTWHSGLKSPVTLHVASGAFEHTEFKISPGGTVSSGPARAAGSFSIWCDPAACQVSPHGIEGSGPGVVVSGR
jgi:hypothetical protein